MTSPLFSKTSVLECIDDKILVLTSEIDELDLELEQMSISSSISPESKPMEMLNIIHRISVLKSIRKQYTNLKEIIEQMSVESIRQETKEAKSDAIIGELMQLRDSITDKNNQVEIGYSIFCLRQIDFSKE